MSISRKVQVGKLLLEKNMITQAQLDSAIEKQRLTGEKLGQSLVELGFIKEDKLLQLLAEQLEIPYINLKTYTLKPEIVHILPEYYARRYRVLVLNSDDQNILLGMVDPQDVLATDEINRELKKPLKLALVREVDLLQAIDMMYRHTMEISSLAEELSEEISQNDYDLTQLAVGLSMTDAPVMKLLQTIFEDAVQVDASDVHIEPDEHVLRIRQRIDGVLHEQILKEKHVGQALTLRLKLMAGLNIAERRLPQDGRFSIKIKEKNFDVRLSTMPVQYGESVVMRLLNQSAEVLNLTQIGMPHDMLNRLRKIINLPNGLLLITGPTGSGKTTTLYGVLSELNDADKKIITVEDPVEYRLPRVNQVQVLSRIDLTFARVLRSMLRQDPDIIMVGELRDQETVAIALRAAMTGHFVFSTLHTNDAVSSALRLLDMGAEGYLVAAVLRAAVAQRLVRRICQNCIEDHTITEQEQIWLAGIKDFSYAHITFKKGVGCAYCHNTGYKGQIGVFELLEITPPLADALRRNDTLGFVRHVKESDHFQPLLTTSLNMAIEGITSLDEIIRTIGESI